MKRVVGAIRVVSAEIRREGRYLITQRPAHAVLPLLWEFPGGRVREDETDEAALVRCLRDRIGVVVEPQVRVMEVTHDYDTYSVTLAVYRCELGDAVPEAHRVHAVAWVTPEDFGDYPFPEADRVTVEALLSDS